MENITNFIKENPNIIIAIIAGLAIIVIMLLYSKYSKSSFERVLSKPYQEFTKEPPKSFPNLNDLNSSPDFKLQNPEVPEEIGLGMKYPQGSGVAMDKTDSNSFYPNNPGPLLTDHTIPESYGESSLSDPYGTNGANQGARVLKIKDTGKQLNYKPVDESFKSNYAAAYSDGQVQNGATLVNDTQPIDYSDNFVPSNNLNIQTSPGQESTLDNCEGTYPNVVKYNNFCITEGDIPYGQVINGKVNPRLVSRWESFTGEYSREEALKPIDGLLYPNINVLK